MLVFDIPAKGPNIVLSEELAGHQMPITDIATEPSQGEVSGFPCLSRQVWETRNPGLRPGSATKQLNGFEQFCIYLDLSSQRCFMFTWLSVHSSQRLFNPGMNSRVARSAS